MPRSHAAVEYALYMDVDDLSVLATALRRYAWDLDSGMTHSPTYDKVCALIEEVRQMFKSTNSVSTDTAIIP